jgi:hypothetical protein
MEKNKVLRALVVAPTPTWPLNYGNRKRIYSVCSKLQSLGFEIHYVHYASEGDWRDYTPVETRKKMDEQWELVDHVWPSKPLHDWPKEGDDHHIDEWWDWALENHLSKTFAAREYDVCIVNYTWLSKALELAPEKTYKVLDTHDKFSGRRELLASQGIGKEFFHTTEDQEVIALDRADLVWAIKEEEEADFKNMGTKAKVSTLLHIDDRREASSPGTEEGVKFGFIGANNNINRVNILRFIERATPIFRKYCAPLTVEIAGSICNEIEVQDNPFFKAVGYVDSIDQFYDDIHAAIIPMEFSTGLKIKVAEALSHTKPMFSHKHAMEGFTACHDFHELTSFEDMGLAMVNAAYESTLLTTIAEASKQSFEITEAKIWRELESLKKEVVSKKEIIIVLPPDYGDKAKLLHYIAQARIDFVTWNFKSPTFVMIGNAKEALSHANFIRHVTHSTFERLVNEVKPNIVMILAEQFEKTTFPTNTKVFGFSEISSSVGTNYTQYRSFSTLPSDDYFPSIGHIHLENLGMTQKSSECWVIENGENIAKTTKCLAKLLANVDIFKVLNLNSILCLEKTFKNTEGLPKHIIVGKKECELTYVEEILLEIAAKYNISTYFAFQNQLLFKKNLNQKTSYDDNFFAIWTRFYNQQLTSAIGTDSLI